MSSQKRLFKAITVISSASIVGFGLGFYKEVLTAKYFGAGAEMDAFNIAVLIPGLIGSSVASILSTTIIPTFCGYLEKEQEDDAWTVASSIINAALLFLVISFLISFIFAKPIISLLAPGFSFSSQLLSVELIRIIAATIIITGISGIFTGLLNANYNFWVPAFSGSIASLIVILIIFLFGDKGIHTLAFATVFGAVTVFLIQLPFLPKYFRYSFTIVWRHPGVKEVGYAIIPFILGSLLYQINTAIDNLMASTLPSGSISALNYATKILNLPITFFVLAISRASFSFMSRMAGANDYQELSKTFILGFKIVILSLAPISILVFMTRYDVVSFLFERGAFDSNDVIMTGGALGAYIISLVMIGANQLIANTFYALKDVYTRVIIAVITILINISFNLLLIKPLAQVGLALATSISLTINVIICLIILKRKHHLFNLNGSIRFSLKIISSVVIMSFVVWSISSLHISRTSLLFIELIIGSGVYILVLYFLKMNEIVHLMNYLKSKVKRKGVGYET